MTLIAMVNEKGGCGKTTAVLALARVAARDYKVGVVDLDPQRTAKTQIELKKRADGSPRPKFPFEVDTELPEHTEGRVVFVDTPRLDHQSSRKASQAADFIVIPVRAHLFDLTAVRLTVAFVKAANKPTFWLPSALHRRRAVDQQLALTLKDLNQRQEVKWPILPGLSDLQGQADFLELRPGGEFETQAVALWAALKKGIRHVTK